MAQLTIPITVPVAGGGDLINVTNPPDFIFLIPQGGSPITLGANYDIQLDTGAIDGTKFRVYWTGGDFTLGGNTFTIQGASLAQWQLAVSGQYLIQVANSVVTVTYEPTLDQANSIDGSILKDLSISRAKWTSLLSGKIVLGNASNVATDVTPTGDVTITNAGVTAIGAKKVVEAMLQDSTPAFIIVVDGSNRPKFVAMSGDVGISSAGLTTIQPGSVDLNMLSFSPTIIQVAQVTLNSSDILAINSTPIEIIPTPGVGQYIKVIDADVNVTFGSAAYAVDTQLNLYIDSAPSETATCNCLGATSSMILNFGFTSGSSGAGTQSVQNKGLFVSTPVSNPTTGDGTAVITVWYVIN